MILHNPIGLIELGTTNIKCLIFNVKDDNTTEIVSTSVFKSEGIHNGVVVNLSKASNTIRLCISEAEKKAESSLKKINVIVEQPEFLCTKLSKSRKINGSKIQKEDIEFLLKEAKKQVTLNDDRQSIIHIFNHNYIVDGKTFVEEPINVYANFLSHEMTFITMPKNNIKNIHQAFIECDMDVERIISSTFALAAKLLNDNELQLGSILLDMGFERTSVGVFKSLALVHSATLPIGVNHIIKDISKVCSLSLNESKIIIDKIDFSFKNNAELFDEDRHLKSIFFNESSFRKITESLILNVIKSRLDEIFEITKKQIITTGPNSIKENNLFMVGGGSNLINLEQYCSNFFKIHVNKLDEKNKLKNNKRIYDNFSSCLGAMKIITDGWETEAIPEPINKYGQKTSFFSRIFGGQ